MGVLAILRDPKKGPSLLLQKQFRPPLNKVTIEVPSGLIDEGEEIAQSAIRELKEETGYVGTVPAGDRRDGGFVMWNDPGFCVSSRLSDLLCKGQGMLDAREQRFTPR